jgi:hypothetical protein
MLPASFSKRPNQGRESGAKGEVSEVGTTGKKVGTEGKHTGERTLLPEEEGKVRTMKLSEYE